MTVYYADDQITLHHGDALDVARTLPDHSINCIVTSPPYYSLRDYGTDGQYGLEDTPAEYVEHLRALFAELRRVLTDDGTCWLNLGDSYSATKNLLGIPWRVAFALQDDGWILRNSITWRKENTMPESVTDRLAVRSEQIFLLVKQRHYFFDLDAIREPHNPISVNRSQRSERKPYSGDGRSGMAHTPGGNPHGAISAGARTLNEAGGNPGDCWSIPVEKFAQAHFATFPINLPLRCIQAGCRPNGTVCDPFSGSGTTGLAALRAGRRRYVGIDLNRDYLSLSLNTRLLNSALPFNEEV
jgi:DNA modification methylase